MNWLLFPSIAAFFPFSIVALPPGEPAASAATVRVVRVLVGKQVSRLRVRCDHGLYVSGSTDVMLAAQPASTWVQVSAGQSGGLYLGDIKEVADELTIRDVAGGPITVSLSVDDGWGVEHQYPGSIRVIRRDAGVLDVLNEVEVELYVACVVAEEVWPTFAREAYRAQAIAARSFVLYQMQRRRHSSFDVIATQGAQVYKGLRTGTAARRATQASRDTSGIVLTWRDQDEVKLFSAYYSAVCGGMSQSAAIFGEADAVKPLLGGVACDYCKIAPGDTYRWGPVQVSYSELQSRLSSSNPSLAFNGPIRGVKVIEQTDAGRAVRVRIIFSNDETHDMLAEQFRLAIGGNRIKSTHFQLRSRDHHLVFDGGRGFGHGLGLCQWGAQGQALAGREAGEILRSYYPGAKLTRVY